MRLQCYLIISLTAAFELTTTEREIPFDTCTKMSCFDVSINDDDFLEKDEAVYVFVYLKTFQTATIFFNNSHLEILIVDNENG